MTRLVIHAGDCKSGSTAIQSVLQAGTFALPEGSGSLHYAAAGRRDSLNHHRLSNALHMPQYRKFREPAWTALSKELAASQADLLVVSSERFEFVDPNVLKEALTTFLPQSLADLHIVIYVRPHIERVVSGYVQNVKQGIFDSDIRGFVEKMQQQGRFHFAPRLARWRAVFGPDQLTIRPMMRDRLTEGCVVHDFLQCCLGSDAPVPEVHDIPMANSSLTAPALEVIRGIFARLPEPRQGQQNGNATAIGMLVREMEASGAMAGPKVVINRADAEMVRDIYAEDARACDVQIFGQPLMGPALNRQVEKAPETVPPVEVPQGAVDASMLWLKVLERIREAQQKQQPRGRGATTAQWRGTRG